MLLFTPDQWNFVLQREYLRGLREGGAKNAPREAVRMADRRLSALADLRVKVSLDQKNLEDFQNLPQPTGEMQSLLAYLTVQAAANRSEMHTLQQAIDSLSGDEYLPVITGRYLYKKTDEELAAELCCDPSTVRRNRVRLLRRIAVRLYGMEAIED